MLTPDNEADVGTTDPLQVTTKLSMSVIFNSGVRKMGRPGQQKTTTHFLFIDVSFRNKHPYQSWP